MLLITDYKNVIGGNWLFLTAVLNSYGYKPKKYRYKIIQFKNGVTPNFGLGSQNDRIRHLP